MSYVPKEKPYGMGFHWCDKYNNAIREVKWCDIRNIQNMTQEEKMQLIDKAVAWLSEHNRRDFTDFDGLGGAVFHKNRMLNAFKRAMMEDDESYVTGKTGSYTTSTK